MNKYAIAAIDSVNLLDDGRCSYPREAWDTATSKIFGKGTHSQKKGCPRNAFLGLCEEGLVKGIPPGDYTTSEKNKKYAIDAVKVLREQPDLTNDLISLWKIVMQGASTTHNNQMNVVTALWKEGFIK